MVLLPLPYKVVGKALLVSVLLERESPSAAGRSVLEDLHCPGGGLIDISIYRVQRNTYKFVNQIKLMESASTAKWFSEVGMVDPFFVSHDEIYPLDYALECSIDDDYELPLQSFSTNDSYPTYDLKFKPQITQNVTSASIHEKPAKQMKTNNWNSFTTAAEQITPKACLSSSPLSHIITFQNSNPQFCVLESNKRPRQHHGNYPSRDAISPSLNKIALDSTYYGQGSSKKDDSLSGRAALPAHDHVLAERKRREKLSQRFIALSAIVPGLKKMDKASVLGGAAKYLKHLQERIKTLEEQTTKKNMESLVLVKKSKVYVEGDELSSSNTVSCDQPLPEIEARVLDENVLVRIHCEKQKGCLAKILDELEKHHLDVTDCNILPFGKATIVVTIVAQKVDVNFSMSWKDLVLNLRRALA